MPFVVLVNDSSKLPLRQLKLDQCKRCIGPHRNFLSAATGIVLAVVLIRGFARASARTVGNFWVDITRCTLSSR
jgi:hypothetical protein